MLDLEALKTAAGQNRNFLFGQKHVAHLVWSIFGVGLYHITLADPHRLGLDASLMDPSQ